MKSKILMLTAFIGVTGASLANAAGVVNFDGQLLPQTCAVSVEGGGATGTVNMPRVSTGLLTAAGQTAGRTAFTIQLRQCAVVQGSAAAIFDPGATVDPASGNLIVAQGAGSASGLQLQLLDDINNTPIRAGHQSQRATNSRATIEAGSADLRYAVQYLATGATTAGLVASTVAFSVDYQ